MYRGRMWTQRTIVGYGGPEDTREGVDAALAAGNAGFDVVSDVPTGQAMDPDHPALGPDVGLEGCSLPTVNDLDRLTDGIDLTETDVAWHTVMMTYRWSSRWRGGGATTSRSCRAGTCPTTSPTRSSAGATR